MIDWVELSKAIPYAGVAIVFGLFMILVLREFGKQRKEQTTAQDAKDALRDANYLGAMERRDADWRDFLAQQQTVRGDQWKSVVGELKGLSALISLSTSLLQQHDAWERGMMTGRRISDNPLNPLPNRRAEDPAPAPRQGSDE